MRYYDNQIKFGWLIITFNSKIMTLQYVKGLVALKSSEQNEYSTLSHCNRVYF